MGDERAWLLWAAMGAATRRLFSRYHSQSIVTIYQRFYRIEAVIAVIFLDLKRKENIVILIRRYGE